ncbi:MAG: TSUP family transporter [Chitinophagaceae bacterium]
MSATTIILLVIIGLLAGILSGLVGVGGGIIIVPALVFLLAFSQKAAQGTSLGILLLPVGLFAVSEYYKQGYIDIKVVLLVSIGFVLGGFLGGRIAVNITDDKTLKKIFAVVLIITAIKMLFFDSTSTKQTAKDSTIQLNTNKNKL